MNTISAVYKIANTITGDFYIGSSKDVKHRLACHKCPSTWNKCPNNPLYLDMKKYGVDKFVFEIITEVESEKLKEVEQQFIEKLNPTYNNINANGWDVERYKEYQKDYQKNYRESHKEEAKNYRESHKEEAKNYRESHKDKMKDYRNQLCCYNGETLTLDALRIRFRSQGIDHPTAEAKKYLIRGSND